MKKKLFNIAICFAVVMTVITVFFYIKCNDIAKEEQNREQVVQLNEIEKLSEEVMQSQDKDAGSKLKASVSALQKDLRKTDSGNQWNEAKKVLWLMYLLCILFLIVLFGYVYLIILRPFDKLQDFAEEIAKGNLDAKLKVERINFFGAFTWSFDHMRSEITKARACEKEAIDNNKTVIATLSHDIKTPIASIRAYAEGLDANLDTNTERRRRYAAVIMNKCDEVTKLTNDLFLHSLADLDKLKMEPEPLQIRDVLIQAVKDIAGDKDDIVMKDEVQNAIILLDKKRFEQVMENLINNSRKYADSKIEISTKLTEKDYIITFHDFGPGILDEDMPFVFEKFYRGKNVAEKQGSGLGLYIVHYIISQMNGNILLHNDSQGLEARISLPVYKK